MDQWLFACAAKEIQRYILDGDKLKDMVGGSALVDNLCGDFLDEVMNGLGIAGSNPIVQAAGWARILIDDGEKARRLAAAWPLLVSQYAPGLQMVQALVKVEASLPEAIEQAERMLRATRNIPQVQFPQAGPLVERSQRTGNAAVRKDDELLDAALSRKRKFAQEGSGRLEKKIAAAIGLRPDIAWPDDMEALAGDRYVAVIHADGNSLGSRVQRLNEQAKQSPAAAAKLYKDFSSAIEAAGLAACSAAFREVIRPVAEKEGRVPARIIVLGGDDLTVIVRADLAFRFVETYLKKFEEAAASELKSASEARLTACAGIAFVKSSYPFSRAYELSSSLCGEAKKHSKMNLLSDKTVPASFAFHRVTTSITGSHADILAGELRTNSGLSLAFGPYTVGAAAGNMAAFEDLRALASAACLMPRGAVRTLISDLYADAAMADQKLLRIQRIADEKNGDAGKSFGKALAGLTGGNSLCRERKTPLLDAHLVATIERGHGEEKE
ncbi:MAG: hypothetical protein GX423_13020 [Nitrospiraceae bacterium]|jgi:hypothetical protein|nr:hypothetical protein [Nitrospiraceae bacterium]